VAVNTDRIDQELYDWADPDRPYSFYDLTKDASKLLKGTKLKAKTGFSRLKHWPPPSNFGKKTQEEFKDEEASASKSDKRGRAVKRVD